MPNDDLTPGRIIVPTDFSELAARALGEARNLARMWKAPVSLVHVWDRAALTLYAPHLRNVQAENLEMTNAIEASLQKSLDELAESSFADVEVTAEVLHGSSSGEALATYARPDDLIVISTHGRSGISRLLLGSVTERLLRIAPCRVLVVPSRDAG